MTFAPLQTGDSAYEEPHKVLLYAHHGFGKTTQCAHFQKRYGKGFIISGEGGLKSVGASKIDYLPFSSWDGAHNPSEGVFSFRGIVRLMASPDFKKAGYKWIAIDSLTELSDRLLEHLEEEHKGSANGFAMWNDYNRLMIGSLKWVRDLPYHVLVTCLAKEEDDANGVTQFWPMIKGKGVSKQLPGLFDHVLCGVRVSEPSEDRKPPKVRRFIVSDEVAGWHGKVRDPHRRIKPYERCDDITALLERMSQEPDDWEGLDGDDTPKTTETEE